MCVCLWSVDEICLLVYFLSLMGYEGIEVINPDGSTEDAEEEAGRGRWKQEVYIAIYLSSSEKKKMLPEW